MGARSGQEYIERLAQTSSDDRDQRRAVNGPVPEHPALAGIVRTYAELFDLQHDPIASRRADV